MRQFGFLQIIPILPSVSAPLTICHKDLEAILDDFYNHLVPYDEHIVLATNPWAYTQGYLHWFYRVSHPYMTLYIARAPPKSSGQDILEGERFRDDHIMGMLSVCQCISMIARDTIEMGGIAEGNCGMAALQTILLKARNALEYKQKQRNGIGLEIYSNLFLFFLLVTNNCIF